MRFFLPVLAIAALAAFLPAGAQDPEPPPEVELVEQIDLDVDRTQRMTVPVRIEGRGPYSFIVDTGSERTAISRELARDLGLAPGPAANVHSLTEVSRIETFVIPALQVGQRTVEDIRAPALSRRNLGAEGLLGVDSLQSQRVVFDFERGEMTVTPSRRREEIWPSDTIVVRARSRFGHLMLVDADFEGQRIWVVVDTGAEITVGNNALRRRLERRGRLGPLHQIEIVSVTGASLQVEYGVARRIRVGTANIRDLPVAFADVHAFRQLDLVDRPAILLGMDALQLFERVSFDFANRRVRLLAPETSQRVDRFGLAGRQVTVAMPTS
jgi:predicted aspartyl protease